MLVEAMASGLPVVANRVGGIPALVQDGVTRRRVQRGDVAVLAAALTAVLEDARTTRRTAENGPRPRRPCLRVAGPRRARARRLRGRAAAVTARVAVLVPVHDQAAFLSRAVGSLLAQDLPAFKCVVVDDGSTDGPRVPDDPRVRLLRHEHNRGLGAALNTALAATTAPVDAYLPADDAWDADHLTDLMAALDGDDGAGLAASGVRWQGGETTAAPPDHGLQLECAGARLLNPVRSLLGDDGRPNRLGQALPGLSSGALRVVNPFGTGVADDKRLYPHVEDLVRFELGEEPQVRSVRTLDLGDPAARAEAMDRLDELVLKPRTGSGGRGVTVMPRAPAERRRAARAEVVADPAS